MAKVSRFLGQLFAIAIILGAGWLAVEAVLGIRHFLAQSKPEVAAGIVTAAATVIGSVLLTLIAKHLEMRAEVRREQRAKKVPVYEKLITLFFELLTAEKQGRRAPGSQEIVKALTEFMKAAVVWGSDDVIRAVNAFRAASALRDAEGNVQPGVMFAFENLLRPSGRT